MGKGMAKNLLAKGESIGLKELHLFDPNQDNISSIPNIGERKKGLDLHIVLGSSRDLLLNADVVALSLPSEKVCEKALFDEETGMITRYALEKERGIKVILDHGTNSRSFSRMCHDRIKELVPEVEYVDAPVSGGPQGAAAGSLTVMMGGKQSAINKAMRILQLYSAKQVRFGDSGAGSAAKLINQALVGIHALAACEALKLAEKWEVEDVQALKDILQVSWGQSKVLELVMLDYMVASERVDSVDVNVIIDELSKSSSAAPLRNMEKDFNCITSAILKADGSRDEKMTAFPLTNAANAKISAACSDAEGLKDAPFAALLKLLR